MEGRPTTTALIVYAVGCVAYWLLTGQLVFAADTSMKMLFDDAGTPPPRPHTRTELPIPTDLEQLIMDCLEKDPAAAGGRRCAGTTPVNLPRA